MKIMPGILFCHPLGPFNWGQQTFFSLFKGLFNGAEIEISLMKICTATLPISQCGPSLFPSMTLPVS